MGGIGGCVMPESVLKDARYYDSLPYPEPEVEQKNIEYADLLLQNYAGGISELTSVNLYMYQHIIGCGMFKEYAELMGQICKVEMKHLEFLGKTIKLLGLKPTYVNSVYPHGHLWSADEIDFGHEIQGMLAADIRAEEDMIRSYKYHKVLISDRYIHKLINRIIMDEELHLDLFHRMLKAYNRGSSSLISEDIYFYDLPRAR